MVLLLLCKGVHGPMTLSARGGTHPLLLLQESLGHHPQESRRFGILGQIAGLQGVLVQVVEFHPIVPGVDDELGRFRPQRLDPGNSRELAVRVILVIELPAPLGIGFRQ